MTDKYDALLRRAREQANSNERFTKMDLLILGAVSFAVLSVLGMSFLPDSGMGMPEVEIVRLRIWYMVLGVIHSGSLLLALAVWIVSLKKRQLLRQKISELVVFTIIVILSTYMFLGAALSFWLRYSTM